MIFQNIAPVLLLLLNYFNIEILLIFYSLEYSMLDKVSQLKYIIYVVIIKEKFNHINQNNMLHILNF